MLNAVFQLHPNVLTTRANPDSRVSTVLLGTSVSAQRERIAEKIAMETNVTKVSFEQANNADLQELLCENYKRLRCHYWKQNHRLFIQEMTQSN